MPDTRLLHTLAALEGGIVDRLHLGAQLYVSLRGEVIADLAFGEAQSGVPMRTDSLMRWLSSGKPLTAVAIAMLHERDSFDLNARVADYLPDFAQAGKGAITLRHLLTHTGGFRTADSTNDQPDAPWEAIVARVCAAPLEPKWVPGEKAGYHVSSSWVVLAELVRLLSGKSCNQFVRDEICGPLGMNDSWLALTPDQVRDYGERLAVLHATDGGAPKRHQYWGNPERGIPLRPGGSAWGPVRELGRFYEALLDSLAAERRASLGTNAAGSPAERCSALLKPDTARLFTQRARTGLFDHTFKHTVDFSLGFIVNSNRYGAETVPYGYGRHASEETFGHSGAQSSCAFADPAHGLVVTWATNGTPGEVRHQRRQREINTAIYEDLGLTSKSGL